MGPVVAEVVEVAEPVSLLDQAEQLALDLVGNLLVVPVRVRDPIAAPGDLELVQKCEFVQPIADCTTSCNTARSTSPGT